MPLVKLMGMTQEELSRPLKGSAMERTKRRRLLRNAAGALGNLDSPDATPLLSDALSDDEPLVCEHTAWALGRIASGEEPPGPRRGHRPAQSLSVNVR